MNNPDVSVVQAIQSMTSGMVVHGVVLAEILETLKKIEKAVEKKT